MSEQQRFVCSFDFSRNHEKAVAYLNRRPEAAEDGGALAAFMRTLKWEYRTATTLQAHLNDRTTIVMELSPGTLHAFPIWGELLYKDSNDVHQEPELFDSVECFAAFAMARWW